MNITGCHELLVPPSHSLLISQQGHHRGVVNDEAAGARALYLLAGLLQDLVAEVFLPTVQAVKVTTGETEQVQAGAVADEIFF